MLTKIHPETRRLIFTSVHGDVDVSLEVGWQVLVHNVLLRPGFLKDKLITIFYHKRMKN